MKRSIEAIAGRWGAIQRHSCGDPHDRHDRAVRLQCLGPDHSCRSSPRPSPGSTKARATCMIWIVFLAVGQCARGPGGTCSSTLLWAPSRRAARRWVFALIDVAGFAFCVLDGGPVGAAYDVHCQHRPDQPDARLADLHHLRRPDCRLCVAGVRLSCCACSGSAMRAASRPDRRVDRGSADVMIWLIMHRRRRHAVPRLRDVSRARGSELC